MAKKKEVQTVTSTKSKVGSVIKKCSNANCVSSFQDGEYGVGNRVMNNRVGNGVKCTVCGTIN